MVTFSTVSYGDIHPITEEAKLTVLKVTIVK
nr:ion channel [Francisella tularensis]